MNLAAIGLGLALVGTTGPCQTLWEDSYPLPFVQSDGLKNLREEVRVEVCQVLGSSETRIVVSKRLAQDVRSGPSVESHTVSDWQPVTEWRLGISLGDRIRP